MYQSRNQGSSAKAAGQDFSGYMQGSTFAHSKGTSEQVMTNQFASRIINNCVKNSRNSPAIATNFCLDLNHSDSQLDLPRLVQRFLNDV